MRCPPSPPLSHPGTHLGTAHVAQPKHQRRTLHGAPSHIRLWVLQQHRQRWGKWPPQLGQQLQAAQCGPNQLCRQQAGRQRRCGAAIRSQQVLEWGWG